MKGTLGMTLIKGDDERRFWSKVDRRADSECWPWLGHCDEKGYGTFWRAGSNRKAHRIAFELARGPVPDGLTVDHLCENESCVNPAHLDACSAVENLLRSTTNPGAVNARKTHCRNGHAFTPDNTRQFVRQNGRVMRQCITCKQAYDAKRWGQR